MKPFKRKSVGQQKAAYVRVVRRDLKRRLRALEDRFADEIARSEVYQLKASELNAAIDRKMDVVADAADIKYGSWDKWRHDPKLAKKVIREMEVAASGLKGRQARMRQRAEKVLAKYKQAVQQEKDRAEALIRTAGLRWSEFVGISD